MKKALFFLAALLISVNSQGFAQDVSAHVTPKRTSIYDRIKAVKVISGDVLELENKERVRLIGIDCPENFPNKKAKEDADISKRNLKEIIRMGKKSLDFTRKCVLGKVVKLEFGKQMQDENEDLLAYVWQEPSIIERLRFKFFKKPLGKDYCKVVDDKLMCMLNAKIVAYGYAYPRIISPNTNYAKVFKWLYSKARQEKLGLWKE